MDDMSSSLQKSHLFKKAAEKSGEMFTSQMIWCESPHPSSGRAIIHLNEDRPHKISILMAPNYREQGPEKPKAPVSFRNLKQDKSGRILGLQHARLVTVEAFVLITDATIKCGLHHCMSLSRPSWPRSKVTADAVSTSWMSFRSSSSINLGYESLGSVSAEPLEAGVPDISFAAACVAVTAEKSVAFVCVCVCVILIYLKLACWKSSSDCVDYRSHRHIRL